MLHSPLPSLHLVPCLVVAQSWEAVAVAVGLLVEPWSRPVATP